MTTASTSSPSTVNVEAIPQELRDLHQWVNWRFVQRPGRRKPTKVPINAATGGTASTTDAATWSAFDVALASFLNGQGDGIGFVFTTDDPYTGIDLDDCYDEAGQLVSWAQAIVTRFDTYTELSPSGKGLHIILRGQLPGKGRRKGHIEMYSEGRYFTITGALLDGTSAAIEDCSEKLLALHAEVFGGPDARPVEQHSADRSLNLGDDDNLIGKAQRAKNGAAFTKLWLGDWSAYSSQSEADLALCSMLGYWSTGDGERMIGYSGALA